MPEELHKALHAAALKHGFKPGSERYNRYVYGGMQKILERKRNDGSAK